MSRAGTSGASRWLALAGAAIWAVAVSCRAAPDPAVRIQVGPSLSASSFGDSLGIGVHWEHHDDIYDPHHPQLIRAILDLGLRHVRGFDPAISAELARHGVTSMLVAGPEYGSPDEIAGVVLRANQRREVIDAVEGPNEADLFWPLHHYSYKGQGFPTGTMLYQRELAARFRVDPRLRPVILIGPSLGKTYDPPALPNPFPKASLAAAVTFGNFHPYPFGGNSFSLPFPYDTIKRYYWNGNFPSDNLDEYPYAFDVYAPPFAPRPMAATETGYNTWRNGVTEAVQATYIPRLVAEYVRLGIRRTYLYELIDAAHDPAGGNPDAHFGLMRSDLSRKPAFAALQSLLALTRPAGAQSGPADGPELTLRAHLPTGLNRARDVHSLVLRQGGGRAVMLLWLEVASADTASSPPRTIAVPVGSVDVEAAQPWHVTGWFAYGPDWRLHRHQTGSGTAVPLEDRIVLVSLQRQIQRETHR